MTGVISFSARRRFEDGQTVFTRHHQVQNQHVEVFAHPKALHSFAVFAHEDVEAIFAEIAAQQSRRRGSSSTMRILGVRSTLWAPWTGFFNKSIKKWRMICRCMNCFIRKGFAPPSGNRELQIGARAFELQTFALSLMLAGMEQPSLQEE